MIIVACRIVERRESVRFHLLHGRWGKFAAQTFEIIAVGAESELVVVFQTVQPDVLIAARFLAVVERVGQRVLSAHASPHCGFRVLCAA